MDPRGPSLIRQRISGRGPLCFPHPSVRAAFHPFQHQQHQLYGSEEEEEEEEEENKEKEEEAFSVSSVDDR